MATGQADILARRPARREGYRLENLSGELLLYHPDDVKVVYCNETATLVWHLCDGQRTVREIVDLLAESFPESAGDVTDDVTAVIEHLCSSKVLTC